MWQEEFFRLNPSHSAWFGMWAKSIGAAALVAAGIFATLDAIDSLESATPWFAAKQWAGAVFGAEPEGAAEARVLLAFAAGQSGLPGLGRVRIWTGDKLAGSGANGMFSPLVYKITLGEGFAEAASYEQRWLVFHEAGHAAALLTGRTEPEPLPSWGLSGAAAAAMRGSIVYQQAFAESFADVFASAMALRVDRTDPAARSEIQRALSERVGSVSLAHDTQPALEIAARNMGALSKLRGRELLALIDAIASEGAALSVGSWGAEREALCLGGWRGWSRWARDGAHQTASNPWMMASAAAPAADEPMAAELVELMRLTPKRGERREMLESSWPAYLARSRELGAAPRGSPPVWAQMSSLPFSGGASSRASRVEDAWGRALAEYERPARGIWGSMIALPFDGLGVLSGEPRPQGCP